MDLLLPNRVWQPIPPFETRKGVNCSQDACAYGFGIKVEGSVGSVSHRPPLPLLGSPHLFGVLQSPPHSVIL